MSNRVNKNADFIKEQYIQYFETYRQHITLSWQIPTLAIAVFVLVASFEPEKLVSPNKTSFMLPVSLLLLGLFMWLLAVHNIRNLLYIRYYAELLLKLENQYGVKLDALHIKMQPTFKWWQKISSGKFLSLFLFLFGIIAISLSIYHLIVFLCTVT